MIGTAIYLGTMAAMMAVILISNPYRRKR